MVDAILYLDPTSRLNLQAQIRQKLIDAIRMGIFPPSSRLPSSRKLALQLGVARNTVVLAYQQLVDEGILESRERSGIYVGEAVVQSVLQGVSARAPDKKAGLDWQNYFRFDSVKTNPYKHPANWQQYPYPFLEGQFETSLYPIQAWREATRLSLGVRDIGQWSTHNDEVDDQLLIEEIRTKVLPRRGIQAQSNEILITVGAQQAIYLITQLLVDSTTPVAVEEPCSPELRAMVAACHAPVIHQPVDEGGLVVDRKLNAARLVFVTPSHQVPTTVTMSMARREALLEDASRYDQLIVEDDFESETNYFGSNHPALRSMDTDNRVIYVSSFSKVLAPGVSLGFMVAAPELIEAARNLRQLMVRNPPLNNQRVMAYFLSLGHHDTYMLRLSQIFRERWIELRDALNYFLHQYSVTLPCQGGTTCWVRAPEGVNVEKLIYEAAKLGILLESVSHFYAFPDNAGNCFRMGVTSLPVDRIRPGVEKLAQLIRQMSSGFEESIENASGKHLKDSDLEKFFKGNSLLSKTIYADPLSIEMCADGRLIGKSGYQNEDCDEGRWWVEGDRWWRSWNQWVYAETKGFRVVLDKDQVKMFNDNGEKVFGATLIAGSPENVAPDPTGPAKDF